VSQIKIRKSERLLSKSLIIVDFPKLLQCIVCQEWLCFKNWVKQILKACIVCVLWMTCMKYECHKCNQWSAMIDWLIIAVEWAVIQDRCSAQRSAGDLFQGTQWILKTPNQTRFPCWNEGQYFAYNSFSVKICSYIFVLFCYPFYILALQPYFMLRLSIIFLFHMCIYLFGADVTFLSVVFVLFQFMLMYAVC